MNSKQSTTYPLTLVLGGTGKTGRRVVERLVAQQRPVRVGSRTAELPYDWENEATWSRALEGVKAAYITYAPDLAVPQAPAAISAFVEAAVAHGVQRLILLSGRGEAEAQKCEQIVQNAGVEWTILRASWFAQNFSEGFFGDLIRGGEVALPAGGVAEPFVDAEDIADVAVAALTEDRHIGHIYELTGPHLLTFAEAVREIEQARGEKVHYVQISPDDFAHGLAAQGVPSDTIALLRYLFTTVLDGRNASIADGVDRALGRKPRTFASYVQRTAATGVWNVSL